MDVETADFQTIQISSHMYGYLSRIVMMCIPVPYFKVLRSLSFIKMKLLQSVAAHTSGSYYTQEK